MKDCDVVIINPCGPTGETVESSLRAHGIRTLLITGPNARKTEGLFLKVLRTAVEEHDPGMIIPVFFPEVLAAHRGEFPGVNIPVDDAQKLRLLDNKISACRLAAECGIPQPRIFNSPDEVGDTPVVLKRPDGQGGDSVYFPKTQKALTNLMKTASEVLITEFIEGYDVCVDVLRWDGFFYGAAYKVLLPKMKGVSRLRESIQAPELVEYARRLLDKIDYKGVCGLDFRIDEATGKPWFLECNPRFSGGLESAIASGFDIPWLLYQLANGEHPDAGAIKFTPGIRTGKDITA